MVSRSRTEEPKAQGEARQDRWHLSSDSRLQRGKDGASEICRQHCGEGDPPRIEVGKEGNLVNSVRKCVDLYTGSGKQETSATEEKTVELVNLLKD